MVSRTRTSSDLVVGPTPAVAKLTASYKAAARTDSSTLTIATARVGCSGFLTAFATA